MQKVAHHHARTDEVMGKVQGWFGRIIVAAAVIGGVVALFTALNSHGNVY
jgi:hypothetical protein